MTYLVINADASIESYSDDEDAPPPKETCISKFDRGDCCLMLGLEAAGYTLEKFHDKSSGVMTVRFVPPLRRK